MNSPLNIKSFKMSSSQLDPKFTYLDLNNAGVITLQDKQTFAKKNFIYRDSFVT